MSQMLACREAYKSERLIANYIGKHYEYSGGEHV